MNEQLRYKITAETNKQLIEVWLIDAWSKGYIFNSIDDGCLIFQLNIMQSNNPESDLTEQMHRMKAERLARQVADFLEQLNNAKE